MKKALLFLSYITALLLMAVLGLYMTGNSHLIKGLRLSYLKGNTTANIYDHHDFDTKVVNNGEYISRLNESSNYNRLKLSADLENMLKKTETTSFLVMHRDTLLLENYYLGHTDSTCSNSFSMAKTITSTLVQMAIEEGKIKSWDVKVKDFLPWLQGQYANELTLRHLSTMTAGLDWDESYFNPFGVTAKAYYGDDVLSVMKGVKVINKPGQEFIYQSGATELLGMCLKTAINQSLAEYASNKFWNPLGAEHKAYWHTDKEDGMELAYCCFNAISRDFARIGRMMLHQGTVGNTHFVDSSFIQLATAPFKDKEYGHSFWLGESMGKKFYLLQGTMGQFIVIVPEMDVVIVRTGHKIQKGKNRVPHCVQTYTDEVLKMLQ